MISACAALPGAQSANLRPSVDWVANSPEWAQEAKNVFASATAHIESVAKTRADARWAVVLDLDETVLNNIDYQVSLDLAGAEYTPETWDIWVAEEAATLVPGAASFINAVNQNGGHVVFITNRRDTHQLATENALAALGIKRHQDFRVLLTRASPLAGRAKQARFDAVPTLLTIQGYPSVEVIAYIGDTIGDKPSLPGAWSFFCINQGGMYGEPCARRLPHHPESAKRHHSPVNQGG